MTTLVDRLATGRWFWPLLLGLNLLLHLPFFNQPPTSVHTWRQANTMAVARNFHEEGMNILRPRVDRRNDSDGVTGMQFPSYEWGVAVGYRLLGFHEAIPRVLNWFIFAAGVVGFYGLVRHLTGAAWLAAVGAWCFAWSAELFYHSINALPDVLALSASVWGLWFFLRWYRQPRVGDFLIALAATTLAGLTKLQYLVIGVPIAALVVRDWLRRAPGGQQRLPWLGLFAAGSVGLTLAWYAYALRLIETSGLADFGLEVRPATSWTKGLAVLSRNLISDLPEALLNFAAFGLLLLGLLAIRQPRRWRSYWALPVAAWAAALVAYHLLELHQMEHHQYYMLPHLPVLVLLAVLGADWLRQQPARAAQWLLGLLLLAQPALAFVRIAPPRWMRPTNTVPAELANPATRRQLEAATPAAARCLVGPDDSGCIYFYFLHKKGFGFNASAELFAPDSARQTYLARSIQRGARYLYTPDSALVVDPRLRPYVRRTVSRVGNFYVLELQSQQP